MGAPTEHKQLRGKVQTNKESQTCDNWLSGNPKAALHLRQRDALKTLTRLIVCETHGRLARAAGLVGRRTQHAATVGYYDRTYFCNRCVSVCNRRQRMYVVQFTLQLLGGGEKLLNPSWDVGKTACVRVCFGCITPNVLARIHPQLIITTQTPTHSPCEGSCRLLSHLLLMVNME